MTRSGQAGNIGNIANIDTLDLGHVKSYLLLVRKIDEVVADRQINAYREFLRAKYRARMEPDVDEPVLNRSIDRCWLLHISLDTQRYEADCISVFGAFLNHRLEDMCDAYELQLIPAA